MSCCAYSVSGRQLNSRLRTVAQPNYTDYSSRTRDRAPLRDSKRQRIHHKPSHFCPFTGRCPLCLPVRFLKMPVFTADRNTNARHPKKQSGHIWNGGRTMASPRLRSATDFQGRRIGGLLAGNGLVQSSSGKLEHMTRKVAMTFMSSTTSTVRKED